MANSNPVSQFSFPPDTAPGAGKQAVNATTYKPGTTGAFRANELVAKLDTIFLPRQEAALLYAANCLEATSDVLKTYIREPLGKSDARAWHMLLDLYQLTRNAREFSALSMVYGARFNRPPPAWDETRCGVELRRKTARLVRDLFKVRPSAVSTLVGEIDRFEKFARETGSSRIDMADVSEMSPEEAELLALVLARLRKEKIALWINHPEKLVPFIKRRIDAVEMAQTRGYWCLLLEIFIIDRRFAEYEEAGQEFTMAFDEAPVPWEDLAARDAGTQAPVINARAGSKADADANPLLTSGTSLSVTNGFRLGGVISLAEKDSLADLSYHALLHAEVTIDMGDVVRIDFDAGGFFFDAIRQLRVSGKKIVLANLNELVAAFLEVFEVQHHAVLVTRVPR
ncbi:MAG: STAS domain-containing protein [Betaproteobacteria bacterium]